MIFNRYQKTSHLNAYFCCFREMLLLAGAFEYVITFVNYARAWDSLSSVKIKSYMSFFLSACSISSWDREVFSLPGNKKGEAAYKQTFVNKTLLHTSFDWVGWKCFPPLNFTCKFFTFQLHVFKRTAVYPKGKIKNKKWDTLKNEKEEMEMEVGIKRKREKIKRWRLWQIVQLLDS